MAESVHCYLKANGQEIQGESSQISNGRENSIECVEFRDKVRTARETGSRAAVGGAAGRGFTGGSRCRRRA